MFWTKLPFAVKVIDFLGVVVVGVAGSLCTCVTSTGGIAGQANRFGAGGCKSEFDVQLMVSYTF